MSRRLTDEEIERQLESLPDWTRKGETITASLEAPNFLAAIDMVREAADEAEGMYHHPDIDIRWRTTNWLLTTHDEDGLTQLDIELAHRISDIARRHGAKPAGEE